MFSLDFTWTLNTLHCICVINNLAFVIAKQWYMHNICWKWYSYVYLRFVWQTDVFLLCYSVDSKTSYDNISTKWSVEVKHHCPKAPLILVGLKTDLRQDSTKSDILTVSDGKRLKNKIKAEKYVECSAKTRDGLTEIFEEACRAALKQKPNTVKKNCILL